MSDHYSEEEDEEGGEDDDFDGQGGNEEDVKVQRKLHLFQSASVQQSIKRLWDLLPKDQDGQLLMEGYVELNLRLQKTLTQEFVLERAIDSAIGDWGEDVREGQRSMAGDEFAMFIFELCSLWCGPSVSLLVYLLFLNATFIAVTDARGAHTVGLRPLAGVERLPQPFFDLLSVQGWARQPEDGAGLDDEQALSAWLTRNLSPESEHATRLQVQRQVFQVTHDVRSVLLFQEGRSSGDAELLDLVKLASKTLEKVSPIEAEALGKSVASMTGVPKATPAGASAAPELSRGQWCPPMSRRPPPAGSRAPDPQNSLKAKPGVKLQKRASSQPGKSGGEQTLAGALDVGLWQPRRSQGLSSAPASASWERSTSAGAQAPPLGRAYDTRLARPAPRGLVLAGQAAMAASLSAVGDEAPGGATRGYTAGATGGYSMDSFDAVPLHEFATEDVLGARNLSSGSASPLPMIPRGTSPLLGTDKVATAESLPAVAASGRGSKGTGGASQTSLAPSNAAQSMAQVTSVSYGLPASGGQTAIDPRYALLSDAQMQDAVSFIMDMPAGVPYKLPRHPTHLYQQQTEPITKVLPRSVVHDVNKWQDANPLVNAPYERVLRKLPADIRPTSAGPTGGPLNHPNEPIWFEMAHRLHGILKRQGKRAERRRKRRLRSKLFRGRSKHASTKRDEGKELREYLDRHKAEMQDAQLQPPDAVGGHDKGEFLGRVHEQYLVHRDRAESRPFRVRGVGTTFVGKKGVGEMLERKQAVVRPVYVPPPPSSMGGR